MRQSRLINAPAVTLVLVLGFLMATGAEAGDFSLSLKAWNASLSGDQLDGDDDLFFPGGYLLWQSKSRLWISASYIEGEVDFRLRDSETGGRVEEVDSDIVIGWNFSKVSLGVGYRFAEFTSTIVDEFGGETSLGVESSGPMVSLGGGDSFGQYRWGYYWALAYMFSDVEDDDGEQEHLNGEAGIRWTSRNDLSVLFGYRYKEYSGDGIAGANFGGPVINLVYTWRN